MEVILIKRVDNLGEANTLVDVKPGYARNYLIPQGYAIIANESNKSVLMDKIREQEARLAKELGGYRELAETLKNTPLRIPAKAGTSGKIFGSVTPVQISLAIKEQFGVDVDRQSITIPEEVKMLGTYVAQIALHKEVQATANFEVYEDEA